MLLILSALFVVSLAALCVLGNFWFTYGIWPRSWWSFALFAILQLFLGVIVRRFDREVTKAQ